MTTTMNEQEARRELFEERVNYPAAMSISPKRGDEDYGMTARDYAVEIQFACRQNGQIESQGGRTLLTGWNEGARTKMTVWVSSPKNAEAALAAVRAMAQELSLATNKLALGIPAHALPLILGIPVGFRIVGTPRIVDRKRPRACGYIGDMIDQATDALARKLAAFEALCAAA